MLLFLFLCNIAIFILFNRVHFRLYNGLTHSYCLVRLENLNTVGGEVIPVNLEELFPGQTITSITKRTLGNIIFIHPYSL